MTCDAEALPSEGTPYLTRTPSQSVDDSRHGLFEEECFSCGRPCSRRAGIDPPIAGHLLAIKLHTAVSFNDVCQIWPVNPEDRVKDLLDVGGDPVVTVFGRNSTELKVIQVIA